MEREPFANFLERVYPRRSDATACDGYYLSYVDLMLLRERAKRGAVIVGHIQPQIFVIDSA